jgi:hypothetical protein
MFKAVLSCHVARVRFTGCIVLLAALTSPAAQAQCDPCDPSCPPIDPCFCNPAACDSDLDGVPDQMDDCPNEPGSWECNGCPSYCGDCRFVDCNRNGIGDACDILNQLSTDLNANDVPDDCEPDCNQSGIPDAWEVTQGLSPDCNGNLVPDSCDIAAKQLEDCNGNGIGDECEKMLEVNAASPRLAPIGFGAPATWIIPDATLAVSKVQVLVRAKGDFSSTMEWLDIAFGDSGAAGTVFRVFSGYEDCQVIEDGFTVELTPEAFNNAIRADGTLQVRAVASIAVDAGYCFDDTWVEFEMLYLGAAAPDCNANGLLDSCELAAGYATDANGNGVIDTCEAPVTQCPGDYDLDQAITGQDLSLLLAAWGTPNAQVDLTGDGQVDGNDMAVLLAGWGSCVN